MNADAAAPAGDWPRCPHCGSDDVWVEDDPERWCGSCKRFWVETSAEPTIEAPDEHVVGQLDLPQGQPGRDEGGQDGDDV